MKKRNKVLIADDDTRNLSICGHILESFIKQGLHIMVQKPLPGQ